MILLLRILHSENGMERLTVTVVVLAVALMAVELVSADDAEDKALAAIKKLSGRIVRDDKKPGRPVVSLSLGSTNATDPDLKELTGLTELQTLDLGGTKVTDAGLKDLAGFQQLHSLDLSGAIATDAGMKE